MNNYTQGVDSYVNVNVHDGLFSGNPRRTPYLYLTFGGPSPTPCATASLPLTKNSATELRDLANKAEKYWAEWESYQQEMLDLENLRKSRLHPVMEGIVTGILRPCPLTGEAAS